MIRFYRAAYLCIALAVCLVGFPKLSTADSIIYNSFKAGKSYDTGNGFTISGSGSQVGAEIIPAMGFTVGANLDLTQIDVAIGWAAGTNSVILSLNADLNGAPGKQIESWTLNNLGTFGTKYATERLFGDGDFLSAGHQYWLVASPGASDTWAAWNLNSKGSVGAFHVTNVPSGNGNSQLQNLHGNQDGTSYATQTDGAFDVLGGRPSVTPEPGTLLLIGTGLCSLFARRRR